MRWMHFYFFFFLKKERQNPCWFALYLLSAVLCVLRKEVAALGIISCFLLRRGTHACRSRCRALCCCSPPCSCWLKRVYWSVRDGGHGGLSDDALPFQRRATSLPPEFAFHSSVALRFGQGKPAVPAFAAQAALFEAGHVARHRVYYQATHFHPKSMLPCRCPFCGLRALANTPQLLHSSSNTRLFVTQGRIYVLSSGEERTAW